MTDWQDALAALPTAQAPEYVTGRLRQEFIVPPWSVLMSAGNGDDGQVGALWQARKRDWLALGIQSELGRGAAANPLAPGSVAAEAGSLTARVAGAARSFRVDLMRGEKSTDYSYAGEGDGGAAPGTSIFDPVLCELVYRWWMPPGGTVLDPFAGGSVRGIVAALLGHQYTGVDLSAAQIGANRLQAATIVTPATGALMGGTDAPPVPRWYVGDSEERLADLPAGETYDLVFTCPPYFDLEVYSDHPADLSHLPTVADFQLALARIMSLAVARLRTGRFAVVVMGEARHKRTGHLYGLVPATIAAMSTAGAAYYNDGVLVTSAGSLPVRTLSQFTARTNGRKLGRQHQYVLVFVKGEPATGEWDYRRASAPRPQLALQLDDDGAATSGGSEPAAAPLPPYEADTTDDVVAADAGGTTATPQPAAANVDGARVVAPEELSDDVAVPVSAAGGLAPPAAPTVVLTDDDVATVTAHAARIASDYRRGAMGAASGRP